MQGLLRGMDYMGTAVFALSGTVTAGQVGMDLMGALFDTWYGIHNVVLADTHRPPSPIPIPWARCLILKNVCWRA